MTDREGSERLARNPAFSRDDFSRNDATKRKDANVISLCARPSTPCLLPFFCLYGNTPTVTAKCKRSICYPLKKKEPDACSARNVLYSTDAALFNRCVFPF